MKKSISNTAITSWLLRLGLVFIFAYAGVSSLQHPLAWVSYLPTFVTQHITATTLIKIFAVYELALALWLLSGKLLKYSAALCAVTLVAIVAMNPGQLLTTFRDVGLACMAAALIFIET